MRRDSSLNALRINSDRLNRRVAQLAGIGGLVGGGVCRLALTDEDRQGRDLVCGWMRELGLEVTIDQIGNVVGLRPGRLATDPVMTGSHIDTVATGGVYDGNLGVLAGLEVIECLNEADIETLHPVAVAFFTNEEGARFAPDMMGSGVHQGSMRLEEMLAVTGIDDASVGDELRRIGYAGEVAVGTSRARCFVELHIEQGPVLEREAIQIGAVTGVQGISWTEYTLRGVSNHAGTTPMNYRHDPGYVAARLAVEARQLAEEIGHHQVATVGQVKLLPNLVNVIPRQATLTVDLRNMDELLLQRAEELLDERLMTIAASEGVEVSQRRLARFEPVHFSAEMTQRVEEIAGRLGLNCRRMPSGAGHDAQMFAPNCPTSMIFVPSQGGISHNIGEYTPPDQLADGANVLLQMILRCATSEES
jgi:N-carbamoyl-L-amino-acid hydrolase